MWFQKLFSFQFIAEPVAVEDALKKQKNYNISELMNPIKIKFDHQLQTNNCTSRVV